MREIEFRGKDFKNNWLYGSLNRFTNDDDYIQYEDGDDMVGSAVYKETVGQYTGLKDKNGTKIFEGDIVKSNHTLYTVAYQEHYGQFMFCNDEEDMGYANLFITEVIGNIYDNPELLGVEK